MGVQGADLDGLARLRASFERQSGTLQSIAAGASTGVAALDQLWAGPDAGQFRTVWTTVHRRALSTAVAALAEAAATIERNRRAQEMASAVDGGAAFGPGGLASPLGPPGPIEGPSPITGPVPTARPVEDVFSEDYMNGFVGRRVPGENSPELNGLLEAVLADDGADPARLQANLDRIADIRGVDRGEFRAQYATYQQLLADDRGVDAPSIDLDRHGDFLGSTASLRYGSVVGDLYGIDPVFGALLNPTGGLVGGADDSYQPGDNDAVGYHGIFHDAAGYLYNHQGIGPGYNYLGREFTSTGSPTTGQYAGISWWVGNHPTLDADLSQVTALAPDADQRLVTAVQVAHALGAEEAIGQVAILGEGGYTIGRGALDVAAGHPSGLGDVARGTGNIIIGTGDNAWDLANKQLDLTADGLQAAGGVLLDHADDLVGPPFTPLTGLFG